MIVSKDHIENNNSLPEELNLTSSQKRRNRRKKLQALRAPNTNKTLEIVYVDCLKKKDLKIENNKELGDVFREHNLTKEIDLLDIMSSKTREEVLAAREAKKQAKQGVKSKGDKLDPTKGNNDTKESPVQVKPPTESIKKLDSPKKTPAQSKTAETSKKAESPKKVISNPSTPLKTKGTPPIITKSEQITTKPAELVKSTDEVDRATKLDAVIDNNTIDDAKPVGDDNSKELIKAERAAKKAAKQAKKKGAIEGESQPADVEKDLTVKDVVETLNNIVNVAKEVQEVTAKVKAIDLDTKKPEESSKSKAELRAERRAKQESQRAAKAQKPAPKAAVVPVAKADADNVKSKEEKTPKQKTLERVKKPLTPQRVYLFQHLYTGRDVDSLQKIAINSNLHPAIVKLGVQLATRVITGSNARCIALLDALKKVVRDFSVPLRAEFGRALETAVASSATWLAAARPPAAAHINALNHFRRLLTQLPNNVDEFDAKKQLQEEIDRYIREQIDTAGEAISIAVRNKISDGDHILTYGCSSLVERILTEAYAAGVKFRTVVVGERIRPAATDMLRRLAAKGLPCSYVDITALSFVMTTVSKVVVGASALLANGSVVAAAGTAVVALSARANNVAVLVACETHKFSDRVQTDAIVHNEIGDPDDLIDKSDENSPLKDWRSNPNLTPLNLVYDVTPPSLVTAVVTELAILPCTSAPVVLRFKLAEYGI